MTDTVKLVYGKKEYELPVVEGSEGEKAIDISQLRAATGFITLDSGYANTGSCVSDITFMDGEKGILRYRGIPVEELAEKGWHETLRGMIFPFHCDHMGHVNNRWYGHFFDDASMSLWSTLGLSELGLRTRFNTSAVIARNEFDYKSELLSGHQFLVMSGFTRIGTKSLGYEQRLFQIDSGELAALHKGISVFFDYEARHSSLIPNSVRSVVAPHIVEPA